jgi:hypothetical protein
MWMDIGIVALLLGFCAFAKRADWRPRLLSHKAALRRGHMGKGSR